MSETPKLLTMTEDEWWATYRGYVGDYALELRREICAQAARVQALEAENQRLTEALKQALKALEMADAFTQPDISRGPAIRHWTEMRAAVLKALRDAPPTGETP